MRILFSILLVFHFGFFGCVPDGKENPGQTTTKVTIPQLGNTSPSSYPGMSLVWADEFDGSSLNQNFWSYETGNGTNGWGNNELQFYRTENTGIQDGCLVITAKKEPYGGKEYTSSRIITKNKKQFQYGRVDIRAALPKGQGIWPALWMLGANYDTVNWPACGEIDIMEMIGGNGREKTVYGTAHWLHDGTHAEYKGEYSLASGTLSDQFYVYSIVWDDKSIRWYIDNKQYHVIDTTPAQLDEFRKSFFFIFNVAVGGNWPGSPNATTTFPQHMIVDYIRVFQAN
jgi:beta-glucanase (GH16 family)